jgi:hypothetical protein
LLILDLLILNEWLHSEHFLDYIPSINRDITEFHRGTALVQRYCKNTQKTLYTHEQIPEQKILPLFERRMKLSSVAQKINLHGAELFILFYTSWGVFRTYVM